MNLISATPVTGMLNLFFRAFHSALKTRSYGDVLITCLMLDIMEYLGK